MNLKGRKWTDPQGNIKYFNSLQAWRIQAAGNEAASPAPSAQKSTTPASSAPKQEIFSAEDDSEEDLPF
jgi:hypothetical protein